MTEISQAATRPPLARVRTLCLATLAMSLVLLGQVGMVHAQKSYKYEDDPIRAGNKALEENKLDVAKAK